MQQLYCKGDKNQIIEYFSSFVEGDDAVRIFESLNENIDMLSSEERFEKDYDLSFDTPSDAPPNPNKIMMSLMIPKTAYYLNLKTTTFLTLCLISGVVLNALPDGNPLLKYSLITSTVIGDVCGLFGMSANTHKLNSLQRSIVKCLWRTSSMTESDIIKKHNNHKKKEIKKSLSELFGWGVVKKEDIITSMSFNYKETNSLCQKLMLKLNGRYFKACAVNLIAISFVLLMTAEDVLKQKG